MTATFQNRLTKWRTRPKHDDARRVEYEALGYPAVSAMDFALRLGPVIALLLAGLGLMLANHFFFAFLDGKSINSDAGELHPFLRQQANVRFVATTIAHGARAAFSIAVGITFAQLFWETLRSRSFTIQEIDALVKCGRSPFQPSVIRAATASFLLFLVACIASALALVVIIPPGSLTVSNDGQRLDPRLVPTVPNLMDLNTSTSFSAQLLDSVTGILASNTYLPPFRAVVCDAGASRCSYNVSFVGPAFDCVDVSSQTNFSELHDQVSPDPAAPFLIWDPTLNGGGDVIGTSFNISILSVDLVKGETQANNCTAYNASYEVSVTLEKDSTSVKVWNVSLDTALDVENTFMSVYAEAAVSMLAETVFAGPNGVVIGSGDTLGNSAFFVTTSTGNHTWSDNITHVLTSYMQNVSLSLLSGNIYTGFSNETATNVVYVNSTSASTFTVYAYDAVRLLSTYGVALGMVLITVLPGCWLALRNGREDKLVLSHIIRFALNEKLFRIFGEVEEKTRILLEPGAPGHFVLVDGAAIATEKHVPESMQWTHRLSRVLGTAGVQMITFILAGLCCMLLHHEYYHYLDWKAPSTTPLRHSSASSWLKNQSIVSDIGIAIAYAGQTLFAAAIMVALVQLFWHTLRCRGRTVTQIDALMKVQASPISPSTVLAGKTSFGVLLVALLATSMSVISIFAPGSIKVSFDRSLSKECTVMTLRNLTTLTTSNESDYKTPIGTVLSSGTYLAPLNPCDSKDAGPACSYNFEFIGPGFDCQDVTPSSNFTEFATTGLPSNNSVNLFNASIIPQTGDRLIQLSVQTWDMERSLYQAVRCVGVSRSYAVAISHNTSSTIEVLSSQSLSPILFQPGVDLTVSPGNGNNISFSQDYLANSMLFLAQLISLDRDSNSLEFDLNQPNDIGGALGIAADHFGNIGAFALDGNYTWSENMTLALEAYAQNATLSLLSGRIFAFSSADGPELLEAVRMPCVYSLVAYQYAPFRLFLTYGVAALVTALCVIWGVLCVKWNGVEESMEFSRFLRAVLNERLYDAQESLDADADMRLIVEGTAEGRLVPSNFIDQEKQSRGR